MRRKNILRNLLTACALVATTVACSNKNDAPDLNSTKSVFMKLDLPVASSSRAVEAPVSASAATVNNLHIYFHDGTNILKYVNVTTTTPVTITNLTSGTKIADVPAAATTVTVYGNIPSSASLPVGGTVAALKAIQLNITTQSTITDVVLNGADKTLSTYTGSGAPTWAPGIQNGDKYAEVDIAPAVARVEIEGLATTATSAVDGFTLAGIFLNNFFEKFTLEGTAVATKIQYGATPANYDQGQGLYTVPNSGKLYDLPGTVASGNPKEVIAGAGQRWAYQVVPNSNDTDVNEQLQLIFRLRNLTAKSGSTVVFPVADQFITVRGFKDNSGNIVKLEPGKIYTISKSDFTFDESDLTTVPVTSAVGVWLKVTVKPWVVVPVKPNL